LGGGGILIHRWRKIRNRNANRFFQQPDSMVDKLFAEAVAPDDGERRAEEDREHVATLLATLLAKLPPKDRRLIKDRFWWGMKLRELGPKHGVSYERARQRLELSLERMRGSASSYCGRKRKDFPVFS
jgi:RNA polymerase sigma factor (sigma-70 family)